MYHMSKGTRFTLFATALLFASTLVAAPALRAAGPQALLQDAAPGAEPLPRVGFVMLDHGNNNPGVVPPNAEPFGKSYGDWGAEWWKWAIAIPFASNPIMDPNGDAQAQGQHGPVWFLAGDAGGFVERTVQVPAGRAIFVPLLNLANDYPCPDPSFQPAPGQSLYDFLASGAAGILAYVDGMTAQLDGTTIRNLFDYRGTSQLSTFTGDPSMVAFDGCITGTPQQFVSDGYWLMLKPLSPGMHTLRITGSVFGGAFTLDVLYHIQVTRGGRGIEDRDHDERAGNPPATPTDNAVAKLPGMTWGHLKAIYR